jgi:hypothetical protein
MLTRGANGGGGDFAALRLIPISESPLFMLIRIAGGFLEVTEQ